MRGVIAILSVTATSRSTDSQLRTSMTLHNLLTDKDTHMPVVRQDGANLLVDLAYRSATTKACGTLPLRYAHVHGRAMPFRDGSQRHHKKPLPAIYPKKEDESEEADANVKLIALVLSNLARISKAQATIVKEIDIVPLMRQARSVKVSAR